MYVKNKKKRILIMTAGGIVFLILCFFTILCMTGVKTQLRSDSAGVEFVTDGEKITCVNITGQFPYFNIVATTPEERRIDSEGNITEVYTIEAEMSLSTAISMRLFIETSEDVTYTYILKFADKDVTISNGKVVE